jgi:transcriptional regulator with XRE-family HTH domain
MQAQSITNFFPVYTAAMKTGRPSKSERSDFGSRLYALREAAGLSQREVAAQLGISQPSYALWERNDVALRPDQLVKLAAVLGVRVEALLNPPSESNRRGGPAGKAKRVFETVSQLPRGQQQKILEVVEALVAQHTNEKAA